MKIFFLCLKLQDSGLNVVLLFNSHFKGLHVGQFRQSPLKSAIIAHRHLCLNMFGGEGLISILKVWV